MNFLYLNIWRPQLHHLRLNYTSYWGLNIIKCVVILVLLAETKSSFRCVPKRGKCDCYLHHVCLSVRPHGATRLLLSKCTLVQAMRLCTGRTTHRGSRGITLTFHDHGTSRGWGVSVTPRPLLTPGKDSVPIVQEAGWAPGPVWTGAKNLAPTGIRSPDRLLLNRFLLKYIYFLPLHRACCHIHFTKRPTHAPISALLYSH
jgi:hypothetical protein